MARRLTGSSGFFGAARFSLALLYLLAFFAPVGSVSAEALQPEASTGFSVRPTAHGRTFMAVTANGYATDAAVEMLSQGGNAMDAAVAAQWVLTLVEPQSSGIGGGGFLLHWDAKQKKVSAWDGRETAHRAASADFSRRPDGSLVNFMEVVATGKVVGTPGVVSMLELAHGRLGALPWKTTFGPAIRLAESGFRVSPRLYKLLADDPFLRRDPPSFSLYYQADGLPKPQGELLRNPDLAETLRTLAAKGSSVVKEGALAKQMVAAVTQRGGGLSESDLAGYVPKQRDPVCAAYRTWRICGMPPPTSGGISVLQLLRTLERSGIALGDPMAPAAVHAFAEAGRLTYADRARYLADPEFVAIPQAELLDGLYLTSRAKLIDPERSMGVAQPGALLQMAALADDAAPELPSTTHLSIVDGDGNAIAFTSSVESAFGSRIGVGGFLLNNQLTDFSWVAERNGKPVANRIEPGKRPLSSMAPSFVFDAKGELYAVVGSAGGTRIINFVARSLSALLDGHLDPSAVLALPNLGNRNGATELERGTAAEFLAPELERRGHTVLKVDMNSGTHLIVRETGATGGWAGSADPRREGVARGD